MSRRKRKKHSEEPENHERWLVSYADFITLLFAFFVVLYATAQKDADKEKSFEESIKKYLYKITAVSIGGNASDQSTEKSAPVIKNPIRTWRRSYSKRDKEIAALLSKVETYIDENLSSSEKKKYIYNIEDMDFGVRVSLAATPIFYGDTDKLQKDSIATVDRLGKMIKALDKTVIIEGHEDDLHKKSKSFPSSWELTSLRSTKLLRYLLFRHNLSPNQLASVAFAGERPVVPNDGPRNRERNRRIDLVILNQEDFF